MRSSRFSRVLLAAVTLVVAAASCSSGDTDKKRNRSRDSEDDETQEVGVPAKDVLRKPGDDRPTKPSPGNKGTGVDTDDPTKLVYLLSRSNQLHSFNPKIGGLAAYHLVGTLDCKKAFGTPQSMAVDRQGWAWVFYDSKQLFKVSVRDATCSEPLQYKHPARNPQLGMGFTSVSPGSAEERLYIMSPEFGLATIGMPSLAVSPTRRLAQGAELTGGGDAKLFLYAAQKRELSEIDLSTLTTRPMHSFTSVGEVGAWAFARYAGKFYLFTSDGYVPSRATEFDPKTNIEKVRDQNIGFVVVGAGQSTLVPPPDTDSSISGDWP